MSKPMFLFAGSYDSLADAEADYEVVKALHSAGDIGSYDSNIISKGPDGKVTVTKTEKPAQHGAWIGLAAGAAASLVFPFLLPGVVAAGAGGAGIGAWIGHLAHGTSRSDAKDLGAQRSQRSEMTSSNYASLVARQRAYSWGARRAPWSGGWSS